MVIISTSAVEVSIHAVSPLLMLFAAGAVAAGAAPVCAIADSADRERTDAAQTARQANR
jgi:hypothetical protein